MQKTESKNSVSNYWKQVKGRPIDILVEKNETCSYGGN